MSLSARVPEDLIEELDRRFPGKCPDIHDSDREIWIYKGKRELVEFLLMVFDEQNENVLKE